MPESLVNKPYWRVKQVAEALSVSKPTVWNWTKQGKLPAPIHISAGVSVWDAAEVMNSIKHMKQEVNNA